MRENKVRRKLAPWHFRHSSCDINISFIFLKNELNCFPVTLKVIGTECGFILLTENDSEEQ